MKYLLVLGFACKVYKKEPRARIFLDNKLIDEFYIPHNLKVLPDTDASYWDVHPLEPGYRKKFFEKEIKNFFPLRFYELELNNDLDKFDLRINIKNNDSNYSNGFLSNSTLIKLPVCMFFPYDKNLLGKFSKIAGKKICTENLAWYYSNKNDIFNLIKNSMLWVGDNKQIYSSSLNKFFLDLYIGGDGNFIAHLQKKYGIYTAKVTKPFRLNFTKSMLYYLIDKYLEHANHRNNN